MDNHPEHSLTDGHLDFAATNAVHADDYLATTTDIAPPLHVSTTFRYDRDPLKLIASSEKRHSNGEHASPEAHVYSRLTAPNSSRLEAVLSSLLHGHALVYASGLAAFHSLLVFLNPKVIAMAGGYHGCHGVVDIHRKLTGLKKVDLRDVSSWDAAGLGKGDVVHLETPLNPTGEASNIAAIAKLAHARGAYLTVDATFGPPGLQDPFEHGADVVMHSGTKYVGGHSDMLCGILATTRQDWWQGLYSERVFLGCVVGSFEGWLGLRSVRTLELRVQRASANATALVQWLNEGVEGGAGSDATIRAVVDSVKHASLQKADMEWLAKQMPNGFGPVFAFLMKSPEQARGLPSKLRLFHHATSLGGVESLIEWRRLSDDSADARLLRVSVGIEDWQDLKADLLQAFRALASSSSSSS